ncbi:MAG: YdcF family protein [Chloroflexota bacterium]
MKKYINNRWIRLTLFALLIVISVVLLPRWYIVRSASNKIYTVEEVPKVQTVIVFGAGLHRDGRPTAVLRDRVTSAAALYLADKVDYMLMSGHAPEPSAMRDFALSLGVPDEAILLDNGGSRTYDSCYHAKESFDLEETILVTQEFHLPRAIFLCEALGISALGVIANNYEYRQRSLNFWNVRETFASLVAIWDVYIDSPITEED